MEEAGIFRRSTRMKNKWKSSGFKNTKENPLIVDEDEDSKIQVQAEVIDIGSTDPRSKREDRRLIDKEMIPISLDEETSVETKFKELTMKESVPATDPNSVNASENVNLKHSGNLNISSGTSNIHSDTPIEKAMNQVGSPTMKQRTISKEEDACRMHEKTHSRRQAKKDVIGDDADFIKVPFNDGSSSRRLTRSSSKHPVH